MGVPIDIRYKDDTDREARITWMEGLVANLAPPANQSRLHTYIQWLRTSDVEPPKWNWYSNYCRGEQRWMGNLSCYEIAVKLSPMAFFTMIGFPVDHQTVFQLSSHSLAHELGRFTGPNLVKKVEASNFTGLSTSHSYLLSYGV